MTFTRVDPIDDLDTIPGMPAWVTSVRGEALEDVTFLSGAVLNHLHLVLGQTEVPQALLRDRLARPRPVSCYPVVRSGQRSCAPPCTFCDPETCSDRPGAIKALGRACRHRGFSAICSPNLAVQRRMVL